MYNCIISEVLCETNMKNLEVADAAETFLDNESRIKSTKFAKRICEYIAF